jgi:hypothetical protein
MPKQRRYSIEIKDDTGRSVWFAAADWTDEERRIAIAQVMRLAGPPDDNCFTAPAAEVAIPVREAGPCTRVCGCQGGIRRAVSST